MAINKRKALSAARKFAQKGAKEKALKEYNALLKADPRDAKLRLEVGDAYRRWGQLEDAVTQYKRVAEQYTEEGFDARAVAVYKQILNLDPKRYSAFVDLSDLYQRIGLEAEAISALQAAADGYREEGQTREALELLRKMAALDPGNTTSRIKVADLLRAEGMEADAVCEFEAVIEELRRVGDSEAIPPIYERILEIQPARTELLTVIARELLALDDYAGAESYARRACDAEPENTDLLEFLSEVYRVAGRSDELAEATRRLAQLFRDRGDSERAREIVQRLPSSALGSELSDSDIGPSPEEFAAEVTSMKPAPSQPAPNQLAASQGPADDLLLGDDELLGAEAFLEGSTTDFDLGDDAIDDLEESPESQPAAELPVPTGAPDQLLAEASVYLRYGKRDQARASLDAALAQEPEHRGVLDKLGEMLAEDGEAEKAVESWKRSAHIALAEGDTDGFMVVRDRIGAIDAAAASALPDPTLDAGDEQTDEADHEPESNLHGIEFDVDVDVEVDIDDEVGVEIDLDVDLDIDLDEAAADDLDSAARGLEVDQGEASETAVDVQAGEDDELADSVDGLSEEGASSAAFDGSPSLSTTTSQQVAEDIEEAEFYFQQDLYDEAEGIYHRVLAVAPNHPIAMVRLGELAVARGDDPSSTHSGGQAAAPPNEGVALDDIEVDLDEPSEDDSTTDQAEFDASSVTGDGSEVSLDSTAADDLPDADETEIEVPPGGDADDLVVEVDEDVDLSNDVAGGAETDEELDVEIAALGDEAEEIDFQDDARANAGDDGQEAELDLAEADEERVAAADTGQAIDAKDTPTDPLAQTDEDDTSETVEFAATSDEVGESDEVGDSAVAHAGEAEAELDLADDDDRDEELGPQESQDGEEEIAAAAEQESEVVESSPEEDGETFDLAAEIRDALEEDDAGESRAALSTVEDGFSSIFSDFKKGVSETLSAEDHETRYDLGIAYREMGLLEDAIGEFRLCLDSPNRRIDSLHMLGLCALDAGRGSESVGYLEQALAAPGVESERRSGLHFDLGRAHENTGDLARARASYAAIETPDYPGLAERLASLEDSDAIELMAADEIAPPVIEPEEEQFESFDDMVAEVEAMEVVSADEPDTGEVLAETEASLEPEVQKAPAQSDPPARSAPKEKSGGESEESETKPSEKSGQKPGKKPPRKRKISFV